MGSKPGCYINDHLLQSYHTIRTVWVQFVQGMKTEAVKFGTKIEPSTIDMNFEEEPYSIGRTICQYISHTIL